MVEALRALRSDGDARRAGELAEQYLRRYPHGALIEEALRLRIEAAVARDDPRAAGYAADYLRTRPAGRYRDLAAQVLQHAR